MSRIAAASADASTLQPVELRLHAQAERDAQAEQTLRQGTTQRKTVTFWDDTGEHDRVADHKKPYVCVFVLVHAEA